MTNAGTPAPKSGMPKWLIILLVIFLVIVLGCCGGFVTCTYLAKRAAEKAMKDSGVEFKSGGMAMHTDKGDVEFGANASLPTNFPSDLPAMYTGLKPFMSTSDKAGGGTVALQGRATKAAVKSYYETAMADKGWTTALTQDTGDTSQLTFTKDDRTASVVIAPGDTGQVTVTLVYGKK